MDEVSFRKSSHFVSKNEEETTLFLEWIGFPEVEFFYEERHLRNLYPTKKPIAINNELFK